MKTKPIISIIIPVYNRPKLVAECLDSVLAQTNPSWECIVVDDGSIDNTWEILKKYNSQDIRFKIFKRQTKPKGANACRNIGIENSRGNFLMFLDSDDILLPNCLTMRLKVVKENPNFNMWIFPTGIFKKKIGDTNFQWNKLISKDSDIIRFFKHDMPWDITGPFYNLSTLKKGKWFDEDVLIGQDWILHVTLLLREVKYMKCYEGKATIQNYCRRDIAEKSMTNIGLSQDKLLSMYSALYRVASHCIHNKKKYPKEIIFDFILRESKLFYKFNLKAESKSFLLLLFDSKLISYLSFLKLYLRVNYKIVEKVLDFISYRFNNELKSLNENRTLFNYPIES